MYLYNLSLQYSLFHLLSPFALCLTFPIIMYCKYRNFSDLTIIAIITTQRKNAIKVIAIFFIALYVIFRSERNR